MAHTPMNAAQPVRNAQQNARRAVHNPWIERLARVGYITKGVVYILIGILALRTAVGAGGTPADRQGALLAVYAEPFGRTLLALITIGLAAFGLWSLTQALLDTDRKGTDVKGVVERIGYGVVAFSYLGLAVVAGRLATGTGGAGKSSDASTQDWTARLLDKPLGVALVILVGLIVLGVAVALAQRAWTAKFQQELELGSVSEGLRRGVIALGRVGHAALSFVFAVIGLFLIVAAVKHDPHQAKGLGGALTTTAQQPFGPALLVVVALGLAAYGVFSLAQGRYRRMTA